MWLARLQQAKSCFNLNERPLIDLTLLPSPKPGLDEKKNQSKTNMKEDYFFGDVYLLLVFWHVMNIAILGKEF
tara:strand:+ start:1887 stop:2105 length:219 start_codon:yes stop_codon:yes gene_type:complete